MSLFDFNQIEVKYNANDLLDLFGEEQIYRHYWPNFKIGTSSSPLRTDKTPSFKCYHGQIGHLLWKDHSTGETGNVFSFVQQVLQRRGESLHMFDVYRRIYEELNGHVKPLSVQNNGAPVQRRRRSNKPKQTIIQAVLNEQGNIPAEALAYWEDFGITLSILKAYNVGYAAEIWIIKIDDTKRESFLWAKAEPGNPIFFYYFPHSKHIKAYRPLTRDKKRKWISNVTNSQDIQGLKQCDIENRKPNLLVLTKSMKDVMWLRSIGIDSIAIHGERHVYEPEFIEYLRKYCKHIISIYDNDIPGMKGAITLRNLYGIPCYFIPRHTGAKDITDLYKADRQLLFGLIEQLKEHIDGNSH